KVEKKTEKTKVVPIEAMVAKKVILQETVPFTGILAPIHAVDIVAEVSGKVEKIYKKLGQKVTTADTLAIIDDEVPYNQYRQAQSQLLSAKNNLKITQLNLESDKTLFENSDISKLEYENSVLAVNTAKANKLSAVANLSLIKKNYKNTRIQSPFSGIISRKHIELGTMVNLNMPLYRVVDLSTLKIEIGISQDVINHVKVGSPAEIIISALNNEIYTGYVRYISPQAEETTGSFKAEIHMANTPEMNIRAGMTAKINLSITGGGERLSIPDYAMVTKNGDSYIYKIKNNMAELHEITKGESIGSQIIVESGLTVGDTIVVVGMKNLGEKTPVYVEVVH
ncbi:MAG: efflux RND transporter periplasmic adaptor subunit, partial [Calditrichia bacterium]|nr:efflux RND transporter periplasmic adaptor subunit [Calditrichia bacterium]